MCDKVALLFEVDNLRKDYARLKAEVLDQQQAWEDKAVQVAEMMGERNEWIDEATKLKAELADSQQRRAYWEQEAVSMKTNTKEPHETDE